MNESINQSETTGPVNESCFEYDTALLYRETRIGRIERHESAGHRAERRPGAREWQARDTQTGFAHRVGCRLGRHRRRLHQTNNDRAEIPSRNGNVLAFPCRAVHASQWMRWSERNKTVGCCSQGDGTTSPGERERQSLSGCRGPFRFLWFRFPATALRRCWLCGCRAKKCSHRDPIPELRRTVPHRTVLSTPMDVMPRGMEWNNTIEQNRIEQNRTECGALLFARDRTSSVGSESSSRVVAVRLFRVVVFVWSRKTNAHPATALLSCCRSDRFLSGARAPRPGLAVCLGAFGWRRREGRSSNRTAGKEQTPANTAGMGRDAAFEQASDPKQTNPRPATTQHNTRTERHDKY